MTIINIETMEENPNMIYDDDHIINGMDKIMKFITHQSKVIQELKEENEELKEEKEELKKVSNVKTNLIENLFAKMSRNDDIDDGISIIKDYGHKYIDEWNKIYEDIIKETINTINKCEFDDGHVYLQFNSCDNIEFCIKDSEEEDSDEEDGSG